MALKGSKKKVLENVCQYYTGTTGEEYHKLFEKMSVVEESEDYTTWLAQKLRVLLADNGISLQDCSENKDILQAAVSSKGRDEGEFYTPEHWCVEARTYLKRLLGEQWGKINIWDASCGTGNLMLTENYPVDKLFLSSLLEEDVTHVSKTYEGATVFQCDFLAEVDYDEYNMNFSENLPEKLKNVVKNNEPLLFFMNPPYKVGVASRTDLGAYMCSKGMSKCALDLFNQFLYRIIEFKRIHKLTNVYMAVFGPVTPFISRTLVPLMSEIKKELEFDSGLCFTCTDFSNTSESVTWATAFSVWKPFEHGDGVVESEVEVLLDAKYRDLDGVVRTKGKRLFAVSEAQSSDWAKPKDVERFVTKPITSTAFCFSGEVRNTAENAYGQMLFQDYALRGLRRTMLTTFTCNEGLDITEENFLKIISSFVGRLCHKKDAAWHNSCQFYSAPKTTVEGYREWLLNGLVFAIFSKSTLTYSYRGITLDKYIGEVFDCNNFLFPISEGVVRQATTDERVLADLEKHPGNNEITLRYLKEGISDWYPETKELFDFCTKYMIESLTTDSRKQANYEGGTDTWDASFQQLLRAKIGVEKDTEERYTYLLAALLEKLSPGVYKYGFLTDLDYSGGEE